MSSQTIRLIRGYSGYLQCTSVHCNALSDKKASLIKRETFAARNSSNIYMRRFYNLVGADLAHRQFLKLVDEHPRLYSGPHVQNAIRR